MTLKCSAPDCDRSPHAKGLCQTHLHRFRRYGDFEIRQVRGTAEERFWPKVERGSPGDCWEWTAKKSKEGYGSIWDGSVRKLVLSHRLSFELHKGEIPEGMVVQHDCDNPGCVNPDHLTLGTHKTNADDKMSKGRWKPTGLRGEQIANARLTESQVRQIKRMTGTHDAVAAKFGVCAATIWNIRTGRTWRHVS